MSYLFDRIYSQLPSARNIERLLRIFTLYLSRNMEIERNRGKIEEKIGETVPRSIYFPTLENL